MQKKKVKKIHKCGYVVIVGMPNAGKSSLMNKFLKEKISIVSPKPQTTRANVTTILSEKDYQIIFIDTPGLLRPRYKMQEVMTSLVNTAVDAADVLLLIIDSSEFKAELETEIVKLAQKFPSKKVIAALNKIDIVKKPKLLTIIEKTSALYPGAEIFPVSALTGEGVDELLAAVLKELPEGEKIYPDDIISTEPERFFVAEIIREAVFLKTKEELPYSTAVVIDKFEEKSPKYAIYASILVEKDSQKPIIIGKNGSMIKEIGIMSRGGIEEFLGQEVYLDLHVKVRKDWRNKDTYLKEIGLEKKSVR
jgi:GTPase